MGDDQIRTPAPNRTDIELELARKLLELRVECDRRGIYFHVALGLSYELFQQTRPPR